MSNVVDIPVEMHYYQFDQQGVAFNMWYLAFVEQARNGYLAAQGFSLQDLLASGHDIQVVHAEIDWTAALRYGDRLVVEVSCDHIGNTSLRMRFGLKTDGPVRSVASVVYVIVDAATQAKAPLPAGLREALTTQQ